MKTLPKSLFAFTTHIILVISCLTSCTKEAVVEPVHTSPVVRLISPTASSILQDSVLVEVDATGDKGIVKVEVYVDNQIPQGGTLLTSPYKYTWNTGGLPDSSTHTIFAKAYDTEGNVSSTATLALVLFKFAPSNLTASMTSDTLVNLAWKDNSSKETGFLIERSTDGLGFALVDSVAANVTTRSLPSVLLAWRTYSFRVRAKSATSSSGYSNIATVTFTFPGPSNLTVTSITSTSASLQWSDNTAFETGFLIERSNDGVTFMIVDSVGSNITTRSVSGVYLVYTPYSFRLRAKSTYNISPCSNIDVKSLFVVDASMVAVATGTFLMGSNNGFDNGGSPPHSVTVGSYSIDKYEITFEKWTEVYTWAIAHGYTDLPAGQNGSSPTDSGSGPNNPVTRINWYDALKWSNARSERDGRSPIYYTDNSLSTVYRTGQIDLTADAVKWGANGYRLPTEAEFEFAAKGGINSRGYTFSGSNNIDGVAWWSSNSGNQTHAVGTKEPNELGLYDMSGNVWEYCWDWYTPYSAVAQIDPKGGSASGNRTLRGGSFNYNDYYCRVSHRDYYPPTWRLDFGFRCVQN